MENSARIRAFVAVTPPEDWIHPLRELEAELKRHIQSHAFKWVRPEQIHVTLRFLGYITEPELQSTIAALETCRDHPAFTLTAAGLGAFPDPRRPRVLWLGIGGSDPLKALQAKVTVATREIGQPPEDRDFKAHLTLARIKEPRREDTQRLQSILEKPSEAQKLGDWRITELKLYRSRLSAGGAEYELLKSFPLSLSS